MQKRAPVIAVFDIGKTNKKLLVFNEQYHVLKEEVIVFDEIEDDDGFSCEDIEALSSWMLMQFEQLKCSSEFQLKAVNFSTYGASLVHVDVAGKRIGHLYNYLKSYPEPLIEEFLAARGGLSFFSESTSSPIMGHLNAGLQLYWLKKIKPGIFDRVATSLHLPQYLSFLISGKRQAEMTSLGCHSAMWSFADRNYHSWLEQEGIRVKLAPVTKGDTGLRVVNEQQGDTIIVGTGLHDSSAAIIPYLNSFKEPFIILSTGTWVISLNPFNNQLPTAEELEKGCLSYLTYQGNPVKTTMLFAGNDYSQQVKRIAMHFNIAEDCLNQMEYNASVIEKLKNKNQFIQGKNHNDNLINATISCAFHLRDLSFFDDAEEAYHQLLLDMMVQQASSTNMVLKNSRIANVYVDGGFCRNKIYMQLLANTFSDKTVFATSMAQGTALGAALALHYAWNSQPLPSNLVTLKEWMPTPG
ncbi:MAG: FGGY family carbohydrate kinase [Niabella sp.]